jgi:beta-lactam-binding protein with PASTA domain
MPQLKLKTLEEIKLILNTYGLVLGNINRNRNEQVEDGLIYEQLPPAGVKIARGEKISVTVSSGFYGSP